MLIETFIRKQLRLKAHTVTKVEESDKCMLVHIDRLGNRRLRCRVCRQRCHEVHDIGKEREWRDLSMPKIGIETPLSPAPGGVSPVRATGGGTDAPKRNPAPNAGVTPIKIIW